jgi:hypothetical protein
VDSGYCGSGTWAGTLAANHTADTL